MTTPAQSIRAADGVELALRRMGVGPALLGVHGSGTDGDAFAGLAAHLPGHAMVAIDRRGHGGSGDAATHALSIEAADIAAALAAIGPAAVIGHSFGGLCALAAAATGAPMTALVLYEAPVVTAPGDYFPAALVEEMTQAVAAGENEAAVLAFARVVRHASEAQIGMMRRQPGWDERVARAPQLARELAAVRGFRLDFIVPATWTVPTLLLLGETSPPNYRRTAEALRETLPGSRLHVLPGQGHGALEQAPALVAEAVAALLATG